MERRANGEGIQNILSSSGHVQFVCEWAVVLSVSHIYISRKKGQSF